MSPEEWANIIGSKIGKYHDNTQCNSSDNSSLISDPSFTPQIRLPADAPLISQQLTYAENEDKLKNALEGTSWKYTNTGITKLSSKIILKRNKLFYFIQNNGKLVR